MSRDPLMKPSPVSWSLLRNAKDEALTEGTELFSNLRTDSTTTDPSLQRQRASNTVQSCRLGWYKHESTVKCSYVKEVTVDPLYVEGYRLFPALSIWKRTVTNKTSYKGKTKRVLLQHQFSSTFDCFFFMFFVAFFSVMKYKLLYKKKYIKCQNCYYYSTMHYFNFLYCVLDCGTTKGLQNPLFVFSGLFENTYFLLAITVLLKCFTKNTIYRTLFVNKHPYLIGDLCFQSLICVRSWIGVIADVCPVHTEFHVKGSLLICWCGGGHSNCGGCNCCRSWSTSSGLSCLRCFWFCDVKIKVDKLITKHTGSVTLTYKPMWSNAISNVVA